jgi:acylphosphatase
VGDPKVVHFREQAADMAPTGSLAGFAGVADEDDKEVQIVACGFDHAVGYRADHIAKGGEKLEENGDGIGLGVGRDGTDCAAGDAVISRIG